MGACKSFFAVLIFLVVISCNDNDGDRLKGSMKFSTVTTGTIDGTHKYLFTFSGLVGDLEIPNGIELGPNSETTIEFNRVGEILKVWVSNVPTSCPNISSKSSTGNQLTTNANPSEPGADYESGFLVPVNGSTGTLEFTIECN